MRSTIKLDGGLSVTVSPIKFPKPAHQGGVVLQLNLHDGARIINLTADQAGALCVGIECASAANPCPSALVFPALCVGIECASAAEGIRYYPEGETNFWPV